MNKLNEYKSWEGQAIQIRKSDSLNKAINLDNLYRHPKYINKDCYLINFSINRLCVNTQYTKICFIVVKKAH